ncbi:MAG TPA: HNH endonuclease [Thermomicrobiaceae bacterium]|nr:HNH endonuclease [Thermomicrobiaceae bacterium]
MRPKITTDKAREFVCAHCGTPFIEYAVYVASGKAKYCSHACAYAARKRPAETRFWENVDKSGDCWIWIARQERRGYGRFFVSTDRPKVASHRYSYELAHGPIPPGMMVCHRCDNPSCVNPAHLFLGTASDNVRDMIDKNRHAHGESHYSRNQPAALARGERIAKSKLTPAAVRDIRRSAANGATQTELARRYGVTRRTIQMVVERLSWQHID